MPSGVREDAGQGIAGDVDGRRVAVGSSAFVAAHATEPEALCDHEPPPGPVRRV